MALSNQRPTTTDGANRESLQANLHKDKYLARASETLESYLDTFSDAHTVRIKLGDVRGHASSFGAAYLCYAYVAQAKPADDAIYEDAIRPHGGTPPGRPASAPKIRSAPGALCRPTRAETREIVQYVNAKRAEYEELRRRYCIACGHKSVEGEKSCGNCGRLLAATR